MLKIFVFVPKDQTESLISAMGNAGAGIVGNYSHCAFITSGKGNWKSEEGSHPTIGKVGEMTQIEENKVEMLCEESKLYAVLEAIHKAHPYEEPEIDVIKLFEK